MCELDRPDGFRSRAPMTYHAAPGATGNGAPDNPGSAGVGIRGARPGATILLRTGTYRGVFAVNAPNVTIKSAPGHWARLDGNLTINADGCVIRDLEVTSTDTDRGFPRTREVGVVARADTQVINCVVSEGGNAVATVVDTDTEWYGVITLNQGGQGPTRGHYHSAYLQGSVGHLHKFSQCVWGPGYGWGQHCYSESSTVDGFEFEGCVAIQSGRLSGSFRPGVFAGGVPVNDHTYTRPYVYGCPIQMDYGNQASDGLTVTGGRHDRSSQSDGTFSSSSSNWTNRSITGHTVDGSDDDVFVEVNAHETGRAMIVAFTPSNPSTITADLSAIYGQDDEWWVFDALNPTAAPVATGTGPDVEVPMTGLVMRTPTGWTTPLSHPAPRFGCFIVRQVSTWVAP